MNESDRNPRIAPEGATCAQHPERPALARCPHCAADACLACWHHAIDRCEHCLRIDPAATVAPIAWESEDAGLMRRVFGTLAAAFKPHRSAPSFAKEETSRAWLFASLATVPLSMLRGVIPFTHTLRFGPDYQVSFIGSPTGQEIAFDILQAMCTSLAIAAVAIGLGGFAYINLSKAFGDERAPKAALRFLLYRSWLLPLAHTTGLTFGVGVWGFPDPPSEGLVSLTVIASTVPLLVYFVGSRATARLAGAVPPLASFAVTLIPIFLFGFVEMVLVQVAAPWLPAAVGAG